MAGMQTADLTKLLWGVVIFQSTSSVYYLAHLSEHILVFPDILSTHPSFSQFPKEEVSLLDLIVFEIIALLEMHLE